MHYIVQRNEMDGKGMRRKGRNYIYFEIKLLGVTTPSIYINNLKMIIMKLTKVGNKNQRWNSS